MRWRLKCKLPSMKCLTFQRNLAKRGSFSGSIMRIRVQAITPTAVFFFQAEDGIRDVAVTGVQTLLFRSGGSVGVTEIAERGQRVLVIGAELDELLVAHLLEERDGVRISAGAIGHFGEIIEGPQSIWVVGAEKPCARLKRLLENRDGQVVAAESFQRRGELVLEPGHGQWVGSGLPF